MRFYSQSDCKLTLPTWAVAGKYLGLFVLGMGKCEGSLSLGFMLEKSKMYPLCFLHLFHYFMQKENDLWVLFWIVGVFYNLVRASRDLGS